MKKLQQYHTTKIIRVRLDPSAVFAIGLVSLAACLAAYLSH